MLRRDLLGCFAALSALTASFRAWSQDTQALTNFDATVAALENNPAELEAARRYREYEYRRLGPTDAELRAQPHLPSRYLSDKIISERARGLMILFEVTNQQRYTARYSKPTWPHGNSGVTIGIGYDLGYVTQEQLREDWQNILVTEQFNSLGSCCGVHGADAEFLPVYLADVNIPWSPALQQFDSALRNVAGETCYAFPGCQSLSSDSFGALVSLVYNRGSAMQRDPNDPLDRRREMRNVRGLVASRSLQAVPSQIRAMKRLWVGQPDAAGLLKRRDLEADLFAAGLS